MSREEMLARISYAKKKIIMARGMLSSYNTDLPLGEPLPHSVPKNGYRYNRLNQKRRRLQTLHGGVHFIKKGELCRK